jgi:RNA polymerase sigma factor (sigma-70 family)
VGDPDEVWRWLATIGRHRLTDIIREQQAAKRGGGRLRYLDGATPRHSSVIELLEEIAVHRHTPSRSAVRREFVVLLEQSMARIDPAYQDAVRLRYIEGLSLAQAAERMSRTEESTKKLCLRGLRALRSELRSISRYT